MSKRHSQPAPSPTALSHAGEYQIIKHDLLRVVLLNVVYLVAVLLVFYTNSKSHYLDRWLSHWLRF